MAKRALRSVKAATFVAVAVVAGNAAATTEFEFGDGWQGNWTTTLSYSKAVRAKNPDSQLYTAGNGALVGYTGGQAGTGAALSTVDEGNLNYRKGDTISELVKLISEVEVKKDTAGGLLRVKLWYDNALNHNNVALGSQANGYNGYNGLTNTLGSPRPLSDSGLDPLVQFQGAELLDAYVYNQFDGIGGNPMQIRLGKQVMNWGESVFVQGVNQINPIDVPSLRRPGTELKEVFIPVWALNLSQNFGKAGTLEGFYQLKYQATPVDSGCGMYWSQTMSPVSSSSPGPCNAIVPLAGLPGSLNPALAFFGQFGSPGSVLYPGLPANVPAPGMPAVPANSAFMYQVASPNTPKAGDMGLAYRFNVEPLDTEFGVYAERLAPRTPVISSLYTPGTPNPTLTWLNTLLGGPVFNSAVSYWEYPAHEKIFGLSASTSILGWSVSGEYSHTADYAAQINGADILNAVLTGTGPYGARAAALKVANPSAYVPGYTLTTKDQIQFNFVKVGNGILGADQYQLVGEIAYQRNGLPDYHDSGALRYGRGFIFGAGSTATTNTCVAGPTFNPSAAGCQNNGFVTKNAWGYRLLGKLEYTNVWDSGVTAAPSVFYSQDVKGYSVDGQFLENRSATNLSVKFTYKKSYSLDLNYIRFGKKAQYDDLRDRDYMSATLSATF